MVTTQFTTYHRFVSPTALVERDRERAALASWWDEAVSGHGRLVLVGGDAGAGKTALLSEFGRCVDGRSLHGTCEPLTTPVPLGPLRDMELPVSGDPVEFRRLFLDELRATATLVVVDDAQWADDSTLDLLRFLGRRIERCQAMVVVAYREDEVGARHPLRVLAGDLSTAPMVRRLAVPPLSLAAVTALASGSDVDPAELHRCTGGNAFFVTQVLADQAESVPTTVRDAVLARAARLAPGARDALDALACLGPRAAPHVVAAVSGRPPGDLDECADRGLVVADGGVVSFRHELARVAVEEAIAPGRAAELHRRALDVLRPVADPARLAGHALRAHDRAALLTYARAAAEEASALGAHKEAAAHLRRALDVCGDRAQRAELLEGLGRQCHLSDDLDAALRWWQEAVAAWTAVGDRRRQGVALVGLAITALHLAREVPLGERASEQAVELLGDPPSGPEFALACAVRGKFAAMGFRNAEAVAWGERVPVDCPLTRALAALSIGIGRAQSGDPAGLDLIADSIRLTRSAGAHDEAGLGYFWAQLICVTRRWYRLADRWYAEAIAFTEDHGQEIWRQWLRAFRARALLDQGAWEEAESLASEVLRSAGADDGRTMISMVVLGTLRARRGDQDARGLLTHVRSVMVNAEPVVGWMVGATRALAETAWYASDLDAVRTIVTPALAAAEEPWHLGELAFLLSRTEALSAVPAGAAEPYRLQLTGFHEEAALRWREIGCPYEAALALLDSDDERLLREALAVFDELGAQPMRDVTARRLREQGVRDIPRRATTTGADGLSAREREVLTLLADGRRNTEIAEELFLSRRTVEHHVASVLRKLRVPNRAEAARYARRNGTQTQSPRIAPASASPTM